ncbi:MAG: hypothetical protein OXI25_05840 [Chloroflexota bacterium]|nr:hypothetical protein [Chloroflexota bacterium]
MGRPTRITFSPARAPRRAAETGQTPPPPAASGSERQFAADLLRTLGDCRFLWLPRLTDAESSVERTRRAAAVTWSESLAEFDAPPEALGGGAAVAFNGTNERGTAPASAAYSFAGGGADEPFSVAALVRPDAARAGCVAAKHTSSANGAEWEVSLDASAYPRFAVYDGTRANAIGRERRTAWTPGAWGLLVATYDGSGSAPGVRLYLDGARVDDANASAGDYGAMRATTAPLRIASREASGAEAGFFEGALAMLAVWGSHCSADEAWRLTALTGAHFGLEL